MGVTAHLSAFRRVFEALCAVCVVVTVVAAAQGSVWWSLLFSALAVASHEVSAP